MIVIDQVYRAGSERNAVSLARALVHRGHQVSFNVTRDLLPIDEAMESELFEVGIEIHRHHLEPVARNGPRSVAGLRAEVIRFRPDVVQAFLARSHLLAALATRGVRPRPALVISRRGQVSDYLGGVGERVVRGTALALADGIIANSDAVLAESVELERVGDRPRVVIPNMIEPRFFEAVRPVSVDTELPVLVNVANLRHPKGQETLLRAGSVLRDEGRPVTIVLVGEGEMADELRDLAAELDVDVRFAGMVADVRPYLARADVYVHPSDAEGMPNAILEAAAAGRPVVATDVGGVREAIGAAGRLVPPGRPDLLAGAVAGLLGDPARHDALGRAARHRARDFSEEAFVTAHLEFYDSVRRH
jgi:glycosyltransferase involved in cell wall biosynthesis